MIYFNFKPLNCNKLMSMYIIT